MSYSFTNTSSQTGTYTESRANYVTGKVYEDLLNMMIVGIITKERANKIRDHLLYFQKIKVLDFFEFQFKKSDGAKIGGLHYKLHSDGYIYTDDDSGQINFWGLPKNTNMTFFVSFDQSSSNIDKADEYTKNWGTGNQLIGDSVYMKAYSKEEYGFKQNKIGKW